MTLYTYQQTINRIDYRSTIKILSTIQVLMAYTPLAILLVYLLMKLGIKGLIQWIRDRFHKNENRLDFNLSIIDHDRHNEDEVELSYQKIK